MAILDTLKGIFGLDNYIELTTTEEDRSGSVIVRHRELAEIDNGTGTNQADGILHGQVTVTTGGITLSLADSADPFGSGGDSVPANGYDPEGKKVKAIIIKNEDGTNYITVAKGTNGFNWLSGTTDTIRVPAGGWIAAYNPAAFIRFRV